MKTKFNATQRMLGHSAMRRIYNLPRNRMLSGAELQAEIDNLARRNAKGTLDDAGEIMLAEFESIGLMQFANS